MSKPRSFAPPQVVQRTVRHAPPALSPLPRPGPVAVAQPKFLAHTPPSRPGPGAGTGASRVLQRSFTFNGMTYGNGDGLEDLLALIKPNLIQAGVELDKARLALYRMAFAPGSVVNHGFHAATLVQAIKDSIEGAMPKVMVVVDLKFAGCKSLYNELNTRTGANEPWKDEYYTNSHAKQDEPNIAKIARDITMQNGQYKEGAIYFTTTKGCTKVTNLAHASYSFGTGPQVSAFVIKGTTTLVAIGAHVNSTTYTVSDVPDAYKATIAKGATATFDAPANISPKNIVSTTV